MWRRICGTNLRTNILSQIVNFLICSDGGGSRLHLNVLSFIYDDLIFVTYIMCFWKIVALHMSAYQYFCILIFY